MYCMCVLILLYAYVFIHEQVCIIYMPTHSPTYARARRRRQLKTSIICVSSYWIYMICVSSFDVVYVS